MELVRFVSLAFLLIFSGSLPAYSHGVTGTSIDNCINLVFRELIHGSYIKPIREAKRPDQMVEIIFDLKNYLHGSLNCSLGNWREVLSTYRIILDSGGANVRDEVFEAVLKEFEAFDRGASLCSVNFSDKGIPFLRKYGRPKDYYFDDKIALEFLKFMSGCMLIMIRDPDIQVPAGQISIEAALNILEIK